MIKKNLILGVMALILSVSASAQQWQEIRVGIIPDHKPFTYKTKEGIPTGFDVDIAQALCNTLKAKCIFVEQQWDQMIPGLIAVQYDAIISSMSITADREKLVAFTGKYYSTPSQVILNKSIATDGSATGLKNRKIGVLKGSTEESYALGELPKLSVQVLSYRTIDDVYAALKAGDLDGAVVDVFAVKGAFLDTPAGQDYGFVGETLGAYINYFGKGQGIAVRKEDNDLRIALDNGIKTLRSNGRWQEISNKYFAGTDIWGD